MERRTKLLPPVEYQEFTGHPLLDQFIGDEERDRWKLPYVATPLNSYELREPNGDPYVIEALRCVERLIPHPKSDLSVDVLMGVAVRSALFSLVEENARKTIPLDSSNEAADLFIAACKGLVTPDEITRLLVMHADTLHSLELAKQTHPAHWSATQEMDEVVRDVMIASDFKVRGGARTQNVRYSVLRLDDTESPSAALVVRKADLGAKKVDDGAIILTQRDSLVLDLAAPGMDEVRAEMVKWMRSPDEDSPLRGGRMISGGKKIPHTGIVLATFMDEQYATSIDRRSPALQPAVRSYYAHLVN